jgi:hypothetical protein
MEEIMKKRLMTALGMAMLIVTLGFYLNSGASTIVQDPDENRADTPLTKSDFQDNHDSNDHKNNNDHNKYQIIVVDVATDARTFRLNRAGTLLDALRGDGFIVEGKIYRGGTIPPGGTMENPGPFDPDMAPGSIGTWICRGTFNFNIGEIMAGAAPHVYTTQHHLFESGESLVHDGPEGGNTQRRALIGGTGFFKGAAGEVIEEPIGVNRTGLFNSRFTFKIKKNSIR